MISKRPSGVVFSKSPALDFGPSGSFVTRLCTEGCVAALRLRGGIEPTSAGALGGPGCLPAGVTPCWGSPETEAPAPRDRGHLVICRYYDVIVFLHSNHGTCDLLQEHQQNILGNTMQSVIALLSNLVACKDSNMKLLYEQGKGFLEVALILLRFASLSASSRYRVGRQEVLFNVDQPK